MATRGLTVGAMATETGPEEKRAKRSRGSIRAKGPNSFQVRVRAGTDPVTGKPLHLHGSASTEKEVQKLLTRLLHEADTERAASTQASLGYLLDRWLPQHDVDETTRSTYESLVRNHTRPALGAIPLSRLGSPGTRLRSRRSSMRSFAGAVHAAMAAHWSTTRPALETVTTAP